MKSSTLPQTEMIDICRKEDGYKDICQTLPIEGCEGCRYHGVKIVEVKK